ncbi:MAG TPA: glycosyltransferase family 2 protein [Ignavibacteria bacterium]|nr:glycosyltransferase family 2 protein [Ignavibacteria bacterium]
MKSINKINKKLLSELPAPPEGNTGWPWTKEFCYHKQSENSHNPKITIITPSFNQGKFIEQTIRSVLLQNYPNLEYMIFDGGSTDGTVEILKKYDKWISFWESKKDKGQSDAINKGLEKSTGKIFNWINSDDYYNEDTFQTISEIYKSTETDLIVGNYRFFEDENENNEKTIDFRLRESLEETIAFVLINQPSSFFRLEVLKELGGLNLDLNFVMDQDIWKKYLYKYGQDRIKIIDSELTHFRVHSNSKTFMNEFNNEYMNIYYSIAEQSGLEKQASFIKNIYGNGFRDNYKFIFELTDINILLSKKVINSLIYYKARIAFTNEDLEMFKKCIEVIDPKFLNEKQKNYLINIKIKTKIKGMKLEPLLKLWTNVFGKSRSLPKEKAKLKIVKGDNRK